MIVVIMMRKSERGPIDEEAPNLTTAADTERQHGKSTCAGKSFGKCITREKCENVTMKSESRAGDFKRKCDLRSDRV